MKRGTDSPWTSYGQSKTARSFGWRCHAALLHKLARHADCSRGQTLHRDAAARNDVPHDSPLFRVNYTPLCITAATPPLYYREHPTSVLPRAPNQ